MKKVQQVWDLFQGSKKHLGCVAKGWGSKDVAATECVKIISEKAKYFRAFNLAILFSLFQKLSLLNNILTHFCSYNNPYFSKHLPVNIVDAIEWVEMVFERPFLFFEKG